MGFEMHSAFERREEWKAARLDEIEYAEMARALKTLAGQQGINAAPVIGSLAGQGLDAALGLLAAMVGHDVEAGYYRCRAQARRD